MTGLLSTFCWVSHIPWHVASDPRGISYRWEKVFPRLSERLYCFSLSEHQSIHLKKVTPDRAFPWEEKLDPENGFPRR